MRDKQPSYKLLFAGILAFFVVMTYDHQQLVSKNTTEMFKVALGVVAVAYLVWYNIRKYNASQPGKASD